MSRRTGWPADALAFTVGMAVFALCAHRSELAIPRLVGLLVAGLAVARGVAAAPQPWELFGVVRIGRRRLFFILPAAALGVALAMLYRFVQDQALLPGRLAWFCVLAAGIGIFEEVAYRGFVQGSLRKYGLIVACAGGAIAHTAYKCSLFALPDVAITADLFWLGAATLVVGFVFGLMREFCGGVLFPVLAHAAFDVVTYGQLEAAPWWVGIR